MYGRRDNLYGEGPINAVGRGGADGSFRFMLIDHWIFFGTDVGLVRLVLVTTHNG